MKFSFCVYKCLKWWYGDRPKPSSGEYSPPLGMWTLRQACLKPPPYLISTSYSRPHPHRPLCPASFQLNTIYSCRHPSGTTERKLIVGLVLCWQQHCSFVENESVEFSTLIPPQQFQVSRCPPSSGWHLVLPTFIHPGLDSTPVDVQRFGLFSQPSADFCSPVICCQICCRCSLVFPVYFQQNTDELYSKSAAVRGSLPQLGDNCHPLFTP